MSLHLADPAPQLLPATDLVTACGPAHDAVRKELEGGAALFFRALSERVAAVLPEGPGAGDDAALAGAVWDLVWAGRVTNDTLAPLRVLLGGGRPAHRARRPPTPRARYGRAALGRPALPARTGPPSMAGRWSLLPDRDLDPTRRAHAAAETLLDRHGVVTRGAVFAERVPGGFAGVYRVLSAFEETGRCRRGYFVEGLGAAQFAGPGAVDRMRALARELEIAAEQQGGPPGTGAGGASAGSVDPLHPHGGLPGVGSGGPGAGYPVGPPGWQVPTPGGWSDGRPARGSGRGRRGRGEGDGDDAAVVLAAADPAQPYGAALPWPARPGETAAGHKPGRKAGAVVVLVQGELVLYVERGGRSLLTWTEDPARLQAGVDALALAVRDGVLGRLTVERADGTEVLTSSLGRALEQAGFTATPRGLRLRS